ncbi:MAG: UV DNA damage repair endonuclease UvsE [Eubacteriales bacterium]|nr:UV DNA damage repair endonuclease UvsE [Eubacteriales bacterium]
MDIGYACLTVAVEGTAIKSCAAKNASPERLLSLAGDNFAALERMVDYNIANKIRLYRISSDLIPFGSSLAANLPWQSIHADRISSVAGKIAASGMRVSMHPGQYTVLNSADSGVVHRAMEDLHYHARVLDALSLDSSHKIILHIGGKYGEPKAALARFRSAYCDLDDSVRRRLVLENDGSVYTIAEVLDLCSSIGAPAVYDNLHNAIHPADGAKSDAFWVEACRPTWRAEDGAQKTHYSQPNPEKSRGAHSDTIALDPFLAYIAALPGVLPDIMLEVKDKNRSAVKCQLCLDPPNQRLLETEWGRYKYSVLERSPQIYQEIRTMLKNKSGNLAIPFYRLVESSLAQAEDRGRSVNALEHVWGYFSDCTTPSEQRKYSVLREAYLGGDLSILPVKHHLYRLAQTYRQDYLLGSYYFSL